MNSIKTYIVLFLFTGVAVVFWDTAFIYPVKLFVVFLHEISHGLAAVATGGQIIKIEVNQRLGGVCHTAGGIPFIVASAGYVGSIFWGGLILLLASRTRASRISAALIGIILVIITVLYVRNSFGMAAGFIFGIVFIMLAKFSPSSMIILVLQFLGMVSCLYVVVDIKEDLFSNHPMMTDAKMLANITHIPAIVWAVFWMAISFLILGFVLVHSHAPQRDEKPE